MFSYSETEADRLRREGPARNSTMFNTSIRYMDSNSNFYPKTWRYYANRQLKQRRRKLEGVFVAINSSSLASSRFWRNSIQSLLVIVGIVGFMVQTVLFLQLYWGYPTTTENSIENSWSMPYPAITVCNGNPIKRSEWCKNDSRVCSLIELSTQSDDFETRKQALEKLEEIYAEMDKETRIKFGHKETDLIKRCKYGDVDCMDMMVTFYDYAHTNCFAINTHWPSSPRQLETDMSWNPGTNDHTKLVLILDVEAIEYVGFTQTPNIRLTVHDPALVPNPLYEGIIALPGNEIRYSFRRTVMNLLPKPWATDCQDYQSMLEKRTNATMGRENCLDECYLNATLGDCDCTYQRLALMYDAKPCSKRKGDWCLRDSYEKSTPYCLNRCRMPCRVVYYDTAAQDMVELSPETLQELIDLEKFNKYNFAQARRNLMMISLAYKKTDHVTFDYKAKYETIAAFSLLGGYIGLWLGVSCATLYGGIENSYHFLKKMIHHYYEGKAKNNKNNDGNEWNVRPRHPRVSNVIVK